MTLTELKAGLIGILKTKYPKCKYYSAAVVENYDRPCFFTQLKPVDMDAENYNSRKNRVIFYITYMAKTVNEADDLRMIDEIRDLMGLYVKIAGRVVYVEGFDWNFVGTDRNIPEISVELYWLDRIEHPTDAPAFERVCTNNELKEMEE